MEFVIGYIIIAAILSMLTNSLFFILFAVISLFILIFIFFDLWFLVIITKLFRTKPKTGRFLRVDTVHGAGEKVNKFKYKVAVYSVDGTECESVFPAEGFFGVYFYDSTSIYKLRLFEKEGRVFDRYNILSCIIWPLFGTGMLAAAVYALVMLIRFRGYI